MSNFQKSLIAQYANVYFIQVPWQWSRNQDNGNGNIGCLRWCRIWRSPWWLNWNFLEFFWNVLEQILSLTSPLQLRRKLLTYLYSLEFDIQKQCILYLSSHQLINRPNLRWPYLYFWIDFFVCRGHTLLWNSFLEYFPVQNWTCITWMPCSWHQKSNSPILQFSNLKSCKMPLK